MEIERISPAAVDTVEAEVPECPGRLKLPYLHRYWRRSWLKLKQAEESIQDHGEWDLENTLLSGLGLNLLETNRFLHSSIHTDFDSFEQWILDTNGGAIDEERLTRLRQALAGQAVRSATGSLEDVPGLTAEELAFWDAHGYVVVQGAVAAVDCAAAAAAIYEFLTPIRTILKPGT